MLNQIVRPFTAKWHQASLAGKFNQPKQREEFRTELRELQSKLRQYAGMLADLAGVEDMTNLAG